MAHDIDVSIILCIDDAAPDIRSCLESLVNQSLSDLEIIAVCGSAEHDGLAAVRDFASQDPRIRIIAGPGDQGRSAARNAGMAAARGRCLRFVDGDDLLPPESTETLFDVHRKLASHIVRGTVGTAVDGDVTEPAGQQWMREAFNVGFAEHRQLWRSLGDTCVYLFDRTFVEANKLVWPEDILFGGDAVWNARCLTTAETISVIGDGVCQHGDTRRSEVPEALRNASGYLSEAVAAVTVSRILLESFPLALIFHSYGAIRQWRRRMTEAALNLATEDAVRVMAEYAKIFEMVPADVLFRFVQARRPRQATANGTLRSFYELLASDVEAAHARLSKKKSRR